MLRLFPCFTSFFFFNLVQKKQTDDFRAGHVEACSGEAKSRLVQGREVNPALLNGLCSEKEAVAPSFQGVGRGEEEPLI